jgi:hypothetical protein
MPRRFTSPGVDGDEKADASLETAEDVFECTGPRFRFGGQGRIRKRPVNHVGAWHDRGLLLLSIAQADDELKRLSCEHRNVLRGESVDGHMVAAKRLERLGMHLKVRMGSGAERHEVLAPDMAKEGLRHLAAGRISVAEKKDALHLAHDLRQR